MDSAVEQAKSAAATVPTTPRPETMTARKSKVTGEKEREGDKVLYVSIVPLANLRKIPEDVFNERLVVQH